MTHSQADVSSVACCLNLPGSDDDSVAAENRVKVQMPRIAAIRSLRTCGRHYQTAQEYQAQNIVGDLDLNGHRSNVHTVQRGLSVLTLQRVLRASQGVEFKSPGWCNMVQPATGMASKPLQLSPDSHIFSDTTLMVWAVSSVGRAPTKSCHGRNFGQAQTDDVPLPVKSVNMADTPDKAMAPVGAADYATLWTECLVLPGNIGWVMLVDTPYRAIEVSLVRAECST
ncbi:predicted protein [Verticillium alfalfae VaMs.102]|uniref:Predicted protein n=1 Tax=Verticillium alfalfae (strain VaMs.102 / ATCC MYA-4576 / FGSC 10136) TaxID=526221 RepID=C9SVJ9_VERA1|nr:predicted protein [Verticillium alfalfae VaMs.102]EEY22814.1 predicted protein [Verticillium alfalfae VaMs.102]